MSSLGLAKFEMRGADCGSGVRFTLSDVSARRTVRCGRGHRVELSEEKPGEARQAKRAINELEKQLKRLGR